MRAWWLVLGGAACNFHLAAAHDDAPLGGSGDARADAPIDALVPFAPCPTLPVAGTVVDVANVVQLRSALQTPAANTTIALADGTYDLSQGNGGGILIGQHDVVLRSQSGNANAVILDGGLSTTPIVTVVASNVSLVSLTIAHAANGAGVLIAPSSTSGAITGDVVYDVTFADDEGAALRVFPQNANTLSGVFADSGSIACSRFTDTTSVDHCSPQTLGIFMQSVQGWMIRDNTFTNVACSSSVHRNMLIYGGSRDVTILRNVIVNSAMSLMLGWDGSVTARTYVDQPPPSCGNVAPQFWGGLVCDNSIAGLGVPPVPPNNQPFDDGISLWTACDTWVMHNTIVSPGGGMTFDDIEIRYTGTFVHLVNNLLEQAVKVRSGGLDGNPMSDPAYAGTTVLYASTSDFANAAAGDLRLSTTAAEAAGASIQGLSCGSDALGRPRALSSPIVGAFER